MIRLPQFPTIFRWSSLSLIVLSSLSLSLTSCTSSFDEFAPTELTDVTITFPDLDITMMPDDATTRATASEAKVKSIILSVFDSSDNLVFTTTQTSADASFGIISTRIPVGDYTFTALAVANTSADIAISNKTTATFSAAPPLETFSTSQEVSITGNTTQSVTMTFGKRITTTLYVKVTDATPSEVQKMQIIVSPSATKPSVYSINPSTGFAAETWRYERTVEKSGTVTTFTNQNVALMFFLTSNSEQLDFTVNMLSATDEVLYTRTKTGVTFNRSAKTIATGTFFSSQSAATFDFDTTEGEPSNIALD